jgi:hypothetical protein
MSPQRAAIPEFDTTAQGCRLTTSVGGVLTGRGADPTIICGHYGFGTSPGDRVRGGSVDSCGSISITKDPEQTTMSETKFVIVTSGLLMLSSSTSFGR